MMQEASDMELIVVALLAVCTPEHMSPECIQVVIGPFSLEQKPD